MPPNTVKVDRSTKWGNPFRIGDNTHGRCPVDAQGAAGMFRDMMDDYELRTSCGYPRDLTPLRGKNLACWCKGAHCHADVLLEVSNEVTW